MKRPPPSSFFLHIFNCYFFYLTRPTSFSHLSNSGALNLITNFKQTQTENNPTTQGNVNGTRFNLKSPERKPPKKELHPV